MAGWRRFSWHGSRWRWRAALAAVFAAVAGVSAFSALLFVFPSTGMPARVDAIVVLGGTGSRLDQGLALAHQGRAPYLVLSLGLPWVPPGLCGGRIGSVQVLCFQPDPDTTQGEARGASQLAAQHGWQSMVLVTTQDQVWRAHLRFERCFDGLIYSVAAPVPLVRWPFAIGYQWAGTFKAETYQRSC